MPRTLKAPTGEGQTLLSIVDDLTQMFAMLESEDTTDDVRLIVEHELRRVVETELADKTDGVGMFIKRCSHEKGYRKQVIEGLSEQIEAIDKREKKVREMVRYALTKLDVPKIKGRIHSFTLSDGRESLVIQDETQVPVEYKEASVVVPAVVWNLITHSLPPEVLAEVGRHLQIEIRVVNADVKAALKAGKQVPGAILKDGEDILTVR